MIQSCQIKQGRRHSLLLKSQTITAAKRIKVTKRGHVEFLAATFS